ncbi:hypothetical protein RHGRI_006568 [Rhododendron griersonianum]|uniref:RNase H type-1 domain-containing protein n=1 Tax=Rhododendron griersonianum TaxID=479676 RepID=A0AAV6KU20_9ERIC|nr:hypothetical protein RHGRI_006568 [Rhododendron griersonianum]
MFRLAQKLRNCRQSLKEWSAKEFGNNKRKLEALKSQLAVIQADCPSDSNMGELYQIKKEIETLLDREEMYYHQRSRINWLRYGDRNTSFFHASVIQRRQRNQLLRLKDDNGDWATSDGDINQLLQGYFSNLFQAIDGPSCMGKIIFLAWQIWKSRNDWVFNHVPVDPRETMARANFGWSEFQGSLGIQGTTRQHTNHISTVTHWECPEEGWVKANCDVAMKKGYPKAAIAVVLRNCKGEVLDGCSSLVNASSATQGEALAVRLACQLINSNQISRAIIESDNKMFIKLCSTENVPPWECDTLIKDIRLISSNFARKFSWVPRACNKASHWVASQAFKGSIPLDWVSILPFALSVICKDDASVEVLS